MIPHARLHPSAPMSIVRTSSRPASATLSEPVNVRTMIRPKRTSETRSIGSSTRLEDRSIGNVVIEADCRLAYPPVSAWVRDSPVWPRRFRGLSRSCDGAYRTGDDRHKRENDAAHVSGDFG